MRLRFLVMRNIIKADGIQYIKNMMKVIVLQVLFLVLNRTEFLEPLLVALLEHGINGATVLQSTGMMRVLGQNGDDAPMFGALRQLFDPSRKDSKTVMMVLTEAQATQARALIQEITGGLNRPDTGILFAIPVLYAEGLEGC